MAESRLRDLSTNFAVKIIKLCETIKGHYSLANQLERSATSIDANIHEEDYAHGKPDFILKLQIALKECYETEYWLELLVKSEILNRETWLICTISAEQFDEFLLPPSTLQSRIRRTHYNANTTHYS